jgi:hypothetical protein
LSHVSNCIKSVQMGLVENAPCGRVDLGRQVLRGGRRRRREELGGSLQRRHADGNMTEVIGFFIRVNLVQKPEDCLSRGRITKTEPSHGRHQETHGQPRPAKAPGVVPVCACFRCDRFIGPFQSRHQIRDFLLFCRCRMHIQETHDHGTRMSCACTSIFVYMVTGVSWTCSNLLTPVIWSLLHTAFFAVRWRPRTRPPTPAVSLASTSRTSPGLSTRVPMLSSMSLVPIFLLIFARYSCASGVSYVTC